MWQISFISYCNVISGGQSSIQIFKINRTELSAVYSDRIEKSKEREIAENIRWKLAIAFVIHFFFPCGYTVSRKKK